MSGKLAAAVRHPDQPARRTRAGDPTGCGEYISTLPKKVQNRPEWRAATEALMLVVERDGPVMPAEIGIRRARNAGLPAPERKAGGSY